MRQERIHSKLKISTAAPECSKAEMSKPVSTPATKILTVHNSVERERTCKVRVVLTFI